MIDKINCVVWLLCCIWYFASFNELANTFHNLIDAQKKALYWLWRNGYMYFFPHILDVGKQGKWRYWYIPIMKIVWRWTWWKNRLKCKRRCICMMDCCIFVNIWQMQHWVTQIGEFFCHWIKIEMYGIQYWKIDF